MSDSQSQLTQWLLDSSEPYTRYHTLLDLLEKPADSPEVLAARAEMVADPRVQALISQAHGWPEPVLQRHNDAKHPLHALSTLADFGLNRTDAGIPQVLESILAHTTPEGVLQVMMNVPKHFGGTGLDTFTWQICDLPTLLYAVLKLGGEPWPEPVQRSLEVMLENHSEVGWRCLGDPALKLHGPGKREDPCPISTLISLKVIAHLPELHDHPAAAPAIEMLLSHWNKEYDRKLYLFATGTHFHAIKYPFIWYDLLHVLDVLSRLPQARQDPRFTSMLSRLDDFVDEQGRVTATSMYMSWKGWSFADKKNPSPWLSFLAARIRNRSGVPWAM